jgi:ATP-binding protein involved in chromosome partitioning
MIGEASLNDSGLAFELKCRPGHSSEIRERLREALLRQLRTLGWGGPVQVDLVDASVSASESQPSPDKVKGMSGPGMQAHGGPVRLMSLPGVRHILAVASGKGGVGKSTIATNLAVGLARRGHKIGLMDADIYGPSLPTMMNLQGRPLSTPERKILPLEAHGVKCMSIGFLVDETEPVIWRGPMVMGVIRQFLQEVVWGSLDALVVDLPPGTGDAQLTLIQAVPISGALIVTTPQDVAVLDAIRGVEMFKKLDVPVVGVVENMSWLDLPDGGRMEPFGSGGGQRTADRFGVPLLAQLPLHPAIRAGSDAGRPALATEDVDAAAVFEQVLIAVESQFLQTPQA